MPEYDPFRVSDELPEENAPDEEFPVKEVDQETGAPKEEVPDGTAKEVLAWVGDDQDKAQQALDVEEAKGDDGKKGLKAELKKLLDK